MTHKFLMFPRAEIHPHHSTSSALGTPIKRLLSTNNAFSWRRRTNRFRLGPVESFSHGEVGAELNRCRKCEEAKGEREMRRGGCILSTGESPVDSMETTTTTKDERPHTLPGSPLETREAEVKFRNFPFHSLQTSSFSFFPRVLCRFSSEVESKSSRESKSGRVGESENGSMG